MNESDGTTAHRWVGRDAVPWLAGSAMSAALGLVAVAGGGWTPPMALLLAAVPLAGAAELQWHFRRVSIERAAAEQAVSALQREQAALAVETASVAHDLRAPLVTVRSYLELLATGAFGRLPDEALDAAKRAAHASVRAQSLIETALHPGARPEPAPVALDEVTREVLATLRADLRRSRAEVVVAPLPTVLGDTDALYRILENLVQNAVKYAKPGVAPRIEIAATVGDGRCEMTVRDYGRGVPASERERVFLIASRGQDALDQRGQGLGLATVRQLALALGGRAWLDPAVTDGTLVHVELPAVPDATFEPAAATTVAAPARAA